MIVSNTKLPPSSVCEHLAHVEMCVDKDKSTSCAPDVDLTSLLAIPIINQPHPSGGRQRKGLILHIRPHSACLLIQACRNKSVCWSLSLSISLTHSFSLRFFLSLCHFFTLSGIYPYAHERVMLSFSFIHHFLIADKQTRSDPNISCHPVLHGS